MEDIFKVVDMRKFEYFKKYWDEYEEPVTDEELKRIWEDGYKRYISGYYGGKFKYPLETKEIIIIVKEDYYEDYSDWNIVAKGEGSVIDYLKGKLSIIKKEMGSLEHLIDSI